MGEREEAIEDTGKANAGDPGVRRLWIAFLAVLLVGLVLSGELVRLHFAAAFDPTYHSYCSVNDTVSCDTVTRSKYSVVFGVPLAVWGVFGYAIMVMTAAHGLKSRSSAPAALLAALTGFSLVVTVLLAAISQFLIHAWCLVCVGTYVVNVTAAVFSVYLLAKHGARASYGALLAQCMKARGRTATIVGLTGSAALALILFFPPVHASSILEAPQPKNSAASPASSVQPIPPLPPDARIEVGVTSDGLPWIGAPKPVVTITEFFDYECSHCKLAYRGLHELLAANPDRLQLVARHFPLDQACNRSIRRQVYNHSCAHAKLANCAKEQQRFWDAHEYLFEHNQDIVEPKEFAAALKLDKKSLNACLSRADEALSRDIEAGIALDLHGTPVFVVDGKPYMQHLPSSLAERLRSPVAGR